MESSVRRIFVPRALSTLAGLAAVWPCLVCAQVFAPLGMPTTPDSQRSALNDVRSQASFLRNATRTAQNYRTGAYDLVWRQFQTLRAAYNTLRSTLTPRQLESGANELAELQAGLDILEEAFGNYQEDLAAGRSAERALRNLCQVLDRAASVWLQEFNRDCVRLRVGSR